MQQAHGYARVIPPPINSATFALGILKFVPIAAYTSRYFLAIV